MSAKLARVLPHAVMLVVACLLYWAATRIDAETGGRIGPAVWPKAVIVFMGLLCVYEIVKRLLVRTDFGARGLLSGTTAAPGQPVKREDAVAEHHRMLLGGIALIAGYVFTVPWIGFFTATAIFLAVFPWIGGFRRPAISIAIALAGALALVVVFMRVAYISLPLGEGPFRALSIGLMRLIGVS
jgi:putative tricarboxylic transport membrane protein